MKPEEEIFVAKSGLRDGRRDEAELGSQAYAEGCKGTRRNGNECIEISTFSVSPSCPTAK